MSLGKVVALVQARMGSTRFPGKMLERLGNHPLLEWVLLRVGQAKSVNKVVLATSNQSTDEAIVELAELLNVAVFRGSESDVLGRFTSAAQQYSADTVVRICADNPFIDPSEIDRLVSEFKATPCDYACNHQNRLDSGYADGFGAEIVSNSLLEDLAKSATKDIHREHVTLYLWDHQHKYQLHSVKAPPSLAFPKLRIDVDTPADLQRLQILAEAGVGIKASAKDIIQIAQETAFSDVM